MCLCALFFFFFFFNDTATTEIYTLSLHDALPICRGTAPRRCRKYRFAAPAQGSQVCRHPPAAERSACAWRLRQRSEEHTSELQSPCNLVCRLLLEKKKTTTTKPPPAHSIRNHITI